MRMIEFRGLAKEPDALEQIVNGWSYGTPFENKIISRNVIDGSRYNGFVSEIEIDPKTISQYTGLHDKNGQKIFEGDICWDDYNKAYGVVAFDEGTWICSSEYMWTDLWDAYGVLEVIGNKWENPELLEGVEWVMVTEGCKYCNDDYKNESGEFIKECLIEDDNYNNGTDFSLEIIDDVLCLSGAAFGRMKINYCPICGRKLEDE